jgi:hypothetical protein
MIPYNLYMNKGEVEGILDIIHRFGETGDFTLASARQSNIDAFVELNFIPPYIDDVAGVLLSLNCGDYKKGPEDDRSGAPGEIYVFTKWVNGKNIYIKLNILEEDGTVYMRVISFHF